ncbi:conjugal transfer protein [Clostridium sp. MCC353]|uniref:cysteine-rich KTR domain-containing protein n=1 Tax=Clostridium sp. MCC353 TaxID=2592646 RepID=UPI001C0172F4|nr:cysteine-rich KTR domain-containing protein [Clostridium sp. MCC353]MBT9778886.1 conjugal transfer protein [Clostridium sp. MCC353]
MNSENWIFCPVCKNKTRMQVREDTVLINFPLFCPKCRQETLISVMDLKLTVHKEPDAKTQSQ